MTQTSPSILVVLASTGGHVAAPIAGRLPSDWLVEACAGSRAGRGTLLVRALESPIATVLQELAHCAGTEELVVYLDVDQPLTTAGDLDGAIELAIAESASEVVAGLEVHERAWSSDGTATAPKWIDSGALYVWRTEQLRAGTHPAAVRIWPLPPAHAGRATEPGDRARCEAILRDRGDAARAQRLPSTISALVLDFDGVFTDNQVFVFQDGREAVSCNRSDAFGLAECRELGLPVIVLSTETNPVVKARCDKLRLPFVQGLADKGAQLELWLAEQRFDRANVVYVGNDINDLECMRLVGCAVAPADAHPRALECASIVLESRGGHGAVREISSLVAARIRR